MQYANVSHQFMQAPQYVARAMQFSIFSPLPGQEEGSLRGRELKKSENCMALGRAPSNTKLDAPKRELALLSRGPITGGEFPCVHILRTSSSSRIVGIRGRRIGVCAFGEHRDAKPRRITYNIANLIRARQRLPPGGSPWCLGRGREAAVGCDPPRPWHASAGGSDRTAVFVTRMDGGVRGVRS